MDRKSLLKFLAVLFVSVSMMGLASASVEYNETDSIPVEDFGYATEWLTDDKVLFSDLNEAFIYNTETETVLETAPLDARIWEFAVTEEYIFGGDDDGDILKFDHDLNELDSADAQGSFGFEDNDLIYVESENELWYTRDEVYAVDLDLDNFELVVDGDNSNFGGLDYIEGSGNVAMAGTNDYFEYDAGSKNRVNEFEIPNKALRKFVYYDEVNDLIFQGGSNDGLAKFDTDGNELEYNSNAERFFGTGAVEQSQIVTATDSRFWVSYRMDDLVEDNNIDTSGSTTEVAFSPDGSQLSVSTFDNFKIYDVVIPDFDGSIDINNPEESDLFKQLDEVDVDFDVTTPEDQEGQVELEVFRPDGSSEVLLTETQSPETVQNYVEQFTFEETGNYEFVVTVSGDFETEEENVEVQVEELDEPVLNLLKPEEGDIFYTEQGTFKTVRFEYSFDVDIESNIIRYVDFNNDGNFELEANTTVSAGSDMLIGTTILSQGEYKWKIGVENDIQQSNSTVNTFEVQGLEPPTINSVTLNPEPENWVGEEDIDVEIDGEVNDFDIEEVEFEMGHYPTFQKSVTETRTLQASELDSLDSNSFQHFIEDIDYWRDVFQTYEYEALVTVTDTEGFTDSMTASGTVPQAEPIITEFEVIPEPGEIQHGESFSVQSEGEVHADPINQIVYSVRLSETDFEPDPVIKDPDAQDSESFLDAESEAFEFSEEWGGSKATFEVLVEDDFGRTDTATVQYQFGSPPEEFILDSPEEGEIFLISKGETSADIDFEYGIETAQFSGTLELLVNDQVVDSVQAGEEELVTETHTETMSEGEHSYSLSFEDSQGDSYTSETVNFQITDEPVSISLTEPGDGEIFNIGGLDSLDITHGFDYDTRLMGLNDHYYTLELEDENGMVVEEIESDTRESGEYSVEEELTLTEESDYTWTVTVLSASDDEILESSSRTYSIEDNPLFQQNIDSPFDGATYTVEEGETRNVSYGFTVETFAESAQYTLTLDDETVRTEEVGEETEETFSGQLEDLNEGSYTLQLYGEDESGRTNTITASFEVVTEEDEDETVDIHTVEFTPSLEEARPGDELDVYIEGSGLPENVDFVEIELEVAGDVETFIVPVDELEEGSWSWAGSTGITVKEAWGGATAKITGIVTDVFGRTSQFFRQTVLGSDIQMFGVLDTPRQGDVFLQEEGVEENIPFSGSVSAGFDQVDWNVEVDDQNLFGGSLDPEEETEFGQFREPSDWSSEQFGEFTARLVLNNAETGEQTSYTNTFEVLEDTGEPVISILNPRQGSQIETSPNEDSAEVTLQYRVQTDLTGTTSLELENLDEGRQIIEVDVDEEVTSSEAGAGEAFRTADVDLDEATYLMRAMFEDSDGQEALRERTFIVTDEALEFEDENEVNLISPREPAEIPKQVGTKIEWNAMHDQSIGTVESTFYVEDSDGNVVFTDSKTAPQVEETNLFSGWLDVELSPGNYQFYADMELETETLETQRRNLTVLDSQPPSTSLSEQDLGSFAPGDDGVAEIEAEFTTQTFQQGVTLELVTREKGTNNRVVRYTAEQDEFRQIMHNASWEEFESGIYEYYVRMETNPTYTSDTGTYTVESDDPDEPLIELDRPEQDEVFSYNNSNASVPFMFEAEAYTLSNTEFSLLLETVDEDDSEFEEIDSFTLNEDDGLYTYSEEFELEESGYRYQVVATYDEEEWTSDTVSFVVDDESTERPEMPSVDERFDIFSRLSDFGERFLGDNSDFILGFALLMAVSVGATVKTRSDKIGLATMIAVALGLSYTGAFPSWISAVLTLLAVGISVWTVNLLVEGRGEL